MKNKNANHYWRTQRIDLRIRNHVTTVPVETIEARKRYELIEELREVKRISGEVWD